MDRSKTLERKKDRRGFQKPNVQIGNMDSDDKISKISISNLKSNNSKSRKSKSSGGGSSSKEGDKQREVQGSLVAISASAKEDKGMSKL